MNILNRRFNSFLFAQRSLSITAALGLLLVCGFASAGIAQSSPGLNFGNNYFVTGDYVVAGVGLRGLGDSTGYATGTIQLPDANTAPATGVPPGAQIVAAFLYWDTVESSQSAFAGQNGFFRPVFAGGPTTGYAISGAILGNPNAPVSWSPGGCSGSAMGSKTMRVYRADVRPFLPVDSNGNVLANGNYEVRLPDSGSNGGGAPLTLGASLVMIYRVLSPDFPLKSVIIYDGAFAPSNTSSTMSLSMQGFYQASASADVKLTHIVANGQNNKYETVYLNGVSLPSLYPGLPPFPGFYSGDWDNPTWTFSGAGNPILPNASSATTMVLPSSSNSGCVSWGVVIMSTTVQNSDHDGILNVWKMNQGFCDAAINGGVCNTGDTSDPGWVPLPGAAVGQKDVFVQMDYMCRNAISNTACDTTGGNYSFLPSSAARTEIVNSFAPHGIHLHLISTNAIQEATCTDDLSTSPPKLCPAPNQPGVIGWKAGLVFLKNQPLNYPDENSCETQTPPGGIAGSGPTCIRRFQHGKKDTYHYALFGHALAAPSWALLGGTLTSAVASGHAVTFTTSTNHGLIVDPIAGSGRVNISGAISNPSLNGTYLVQAVPSPTSFTVQTATSASGSYTFTTDPNLSVASGQAGTVSGASDVGGEDTAVTLGSWGPDGQSDNVQAGVFMHELGHTLALTHGGLYFDTAGSFNPTLEPNCKANFQSVMNYLFTVDLLGPSQTLDYSEQSLSSLNETSLPGGITTTDSSPLAYSTTKWYATSSPFGVGTQATRHCDGSPILPTDPQPSMYRLEGVGNPISPAWSSPQDITFNGAFDSSLRGYNDWAKLDLRQMGAAGSMSTSGGPNTAGFGPNTAGFGPNTAGFGPNTVGLGPNTAGLGPNTVGFGPNTAGLGPGHSEVNFETINSITRPPRGLTATMLTHPTAVQLNWTAPTFGQIGVYNIYRGADGAIPTFFSSVSGTPPATTFTDSSVHCGTHTYIYFVTAVLGGTSQESVASNTVRITGCTVVP